MNCPKCNYDMFSIYNEVLNGKGSKYCRITNIYTRMNFEVIGGTDWDVEFLCPKCGEKWSISDSDY